MSKQEVRRAVLAMLAGEMPFVSDWCKVKAVDWDNKTVDVYLDDEEELVIEKILLGFDKSGFIGKPAVGTNVLVLFVTRTSGAVVAYEKMDDAELWGNEYGGIPIVEKLVDRLNKIEDKVNGVISNFNGHTHAYFPGPLAQAASSPPAAPIAGQLTETQVNDIEGDVKHGKG